MAEEQHRVVVMISGSRHWSDVEAIRAQIAQLPPGVLLIHGASATGADAIADRIARQLGIAVERFPAEWNRYGKRAALMRNQEMVDRADRLIAFPAADSRGTTDAIARARKKGIPVDIFRE